jgi:hypothetical protein
MKLPLLVFLASTDVLGSESTGHTCILFSRIRDSDNLDGQVALVISAKEQGSPVAPQSPLTSRNSMEGKFQTPADGGAACKVKVKVKNILAPEDNRPVHLCVRHKSVALTKCYYRQPFAEILVLASSPTRRRVCCL